MAHREQMRPFPNRRVWIPRFNLETNIKFIELYRKHRMLWDPDHPLYGKHAPRYEAYKSIAKAMKYPGLDAASVRSKIKIMRSCYISSRKQIASKAGTSTPHKPVDWFWTADAFLHDKIRIAELDGANEPYRHLRDVYESLKPDREHENAEIYFGSDMPVRETVEVGLSETHEVEEDEEGEEEEETGVTRHVNIKTEVVEDNSHFPDNSIYLELDDEQLMAIENGEMSIEDVTARAEAAASQHQQQMLAARESRESARGEEEDETSRGGDESDEAEDEFDAFGRCVALQLKTLPIDSALELESQIHALITKKRMLLLRKNSKH